MKTLTFCSVFEKIRVRTERIRTAYARRPENAQEMEIYRARRQRHIRKSVLVPSHGNDTRRFQKTPLWELFSKTCVFGARKRPLRVDGTLKWRRVDGTLD